jgi:hypothetical protein
VGGGTQTSNVYAFGHEWGLILSNQLETTWKVSGVFRGGVFEVCVLTRYMDASLGNRFPTFQMNRLPSVGLLGFEVRSHSDTTPYPRKT